MAEPATLTAAAVTGVAVGLTGTFLGIGYDVLLGAFFGGLVVVCFLPEITLRAAVIGMIIAVSTSAMLSELAVFIASAGLSTFVDIPEKLLRLPISFVLAFLAQKYLLPGLPGAGRFLFQKVQRVLGQKIDEVSK